MRKQAAKNVVMKDGTPRRIPGDVAEDLVSKGKAQFISHTIYRALKLGIEVRDLKTRDEDGVLKGKIRAAKEKANKKRKKAEKQREKEERELAEMVEEGRRAERDGFYDRD